MKNVTGGTLPARMWHEFMVRTQANVPVAQLPEMPAVAETTEVGASPVSTETAAASSYEYQWEEPGFFDRFFGRSGNESRPLLQPGGRR